MAHWSVNELVFPPSRLHADKQFMTLKPRELHPKTLNLIPMRLNMYSLKKYWYIPVFIAACVMLGVLVIYTNQPSEEPQVTYVMPERTRNVQINTGRTTAPSITALPQTETTDQVESNAEFGEPSMPAEPVKQTSQSTSGAAASGRTAQTASDDTVSDEELQRQMDEVAKYGYYLEKETVEYNAIMSDFYDMKADELRAQSLAQRRLYLEGYRAELESDPDDGDDQELTDSIIDSFVRAMNERGVYFD